MQSKPQRADAADEALLNLGLELDEIVSDDYIEPKSREAGSRWFVPLMLLLATLLSMRHASFGLQTIGR